MDALHLLAVSDLSFSYPHKILFKNINFSLKSGELLHLAGPNGSGKTTLLSVIAGFLSPSSGKVEFAQTKTAASFDARECYDFLPAEANHLFMKMDAISNLNFWANLRQEQTDKAKIEAELTKWNLYHPLIREKFPVERFSTGMKRRLALARLSVVAAPVWLLDEPTWGLDQQATLQFHQMLNDHLAKQGAAILVSHDLGALHKHVTRQLDLTSFGAKS